MLPSARKESMTWTGGSEELALAASQRCLAVGMRFIFPLRPLRRRGRLRQMCVCLCVCAKVCAAERVFRRPQLLKGYGMLSILNCSIKLNMKNRFAAFSEVSLLREGTVLHSSTTVFFNTETYRHNSNVNTTVPQYLWTDIRSI